MKRAVMILAGGLALATAARAQSVEENVARLASRDWVVRYNAYRSLDQTPGAWRRRDAVAGLLKAYVLGNQTIVETLRESGGKLGISDVYGEEFGEAHSRVFMKCREYCDREALLTQLLRDAEPGSKLAENTLEILGAYSIKMFSPAQRTRVDSAFIAATRGDDWFARKAALQAIGEFVRTDPDLTPQRRARLHETVVASASDKQLQVRMAAAQRLADFGDPDDVAMLRRMAASDSLQTTRYGKVVFPVRETATKELIRIKKVP